MRAVPAPAAGRRADPPPQASLPSQASPSTAKTSSTTSPWRTSAVWNAGAMLGWPASTPRVHPGHDLTCLCGRLTEREDGPSQAVLPFGPPDSAAVERSDQRVGAGVQPAGLGYQTHTCIVVRSGCQKLNGDPVLGLVCGQVFAFLCGMNVPSW